MNSPHVTVCIPTYNCAAFLPEAIESVLKQSFTDFELIIVDDCSTDNTRRIITRYAERDRRIVVNFNPNNLGMVYNWNKCLGLAKGDYIKFLFCDDLCSSSDTIDKMVALLDRDPQISLVASSRNIIDANSDIIRTVSHFSRDTIIEGTVAITRGLATQKNLIGEPSIVMFRRKQAVRGFNAKYSQLVDVEMWFHLLEQGKLAFLKEPLHSFREHENQQTQKNLKNLKHIDDMFLLLDEYVNKPYVPFNCHTKNHLYYNTYYRIWRLYKDSKITREQALEKISTSYSEYKFFFLMPLYKIFNPFWKLKCNLSKRALC